MICSDMGILLAAEAFEFGWGFVVAAVPGQDGQTFLGLRMLPPIEINSRVDSLTYAYAAVVAEDAEATPRDVYACLPAAVSARLELDPIVLAEIERVHGSSLQLAMEVRTDCGYYCPSSETPQGETIELSRDNSSRPRDDEPSDFSVLTAHIDLREVL